MNKITDLKNILEKILVTYVIDRQGCRFRLTETNFLLQREAGGAAVQNRWLKRFGGPFGRWAGNSG